jgi:hypothetical protein
MSPPWFAIKYGWKVSTKSGAIHTIVGDWPGPYTIMVYPRGAETFQDAVETVAHERAHFNLRWTDDEAEEYGEAMWRVIQGKPYTGPTP